MKDLTRNDLLNAPTLVIEPFDIPTLNGRVWIKALSQKDVEEWEQSNKDKDGKTVAGYRGRLLLRCLCDKVGNPLLRADDAERFFTQLNHWIGPLFDKAFEVNTMSRAAVDDVKKNSGPTLNGDSASASQSPSPESMPSIPTTSSAA